MSDYTAPYRWGQETVNWVDPHAAEENDRALEQWLGAPPQTYTPTTLLSDGSVPGYVGGASGVWERQRGQFVIVAFNVSVTGAPGATARRLGVSLPTAPAQVTFPTGGAWWFPAGGQVIYRRVGSVSYPAPTVAQFPITAAGVFFVDVGAENTIGAATAIIGLVIYREAV